MPSNTKERHEEKTSQNGPQTDMSPMGRSMAPPAFQLKAQEASPMPAQMKKPTSEIRKEYQVADDKMIDWSPKALGVEIPFSGSRRMTETEGELLDGMVVQKGLIELFTFQEIHDKAFSESTARYPDPGKIPGHVPANRKNEWLQNDGHRDAFRHCYWNALLARRYGQEWAKQFATAHEGGPGNPAEREAMDLWNNEVGRKIAKDNPKATEKQLADKVKAAVTGGQLMVVNQKSNLAYSNTVAVWDHGFTGNKTAAGKIKADGDVSAKSG